MDLFGLMIIVAVLIGVGSWLFWFAIVFLMGRAAWRAAQHQLDNVLPDLEKSLRQMPQGGFQQLSPMQQQQMLAMMLKAQNQMRQLNDLSRQRYEARVGEINLMAAQAGIDLRS
jgi:hypothetical protein